MISANTVKHCRTILRSCLNSAVIDGLIEVNPVAQVELPLTVNKEAWTYLSVDEIDQLLAADIPMKSKMMFQFAIYSGMRLGEILGLRWGRVLYLDDPNRPTIVQVRYTGNKATKKGGSSRDIALLPMAKQALIEMKKFAGLAGLFDTYVWPNENGGIHNSSYDGGWRDTIEGQGDKQKIRRGWKYKAGIHRSVRFHDLRHTCATHLISGTWGKRWTLYEVSKYLGHRDVLSTQLYAHLTPESMKEIAELTNRVGNKKSAADQEDIENK